MPKYQRVNGQGHSNTDTKYGAEPSVGRARKIRYGSGLFPPPTPAVIYLRTFISGLLLTAGLLSATAAQTVSPSQRLKQIGDHYFQEGLRLNPLSGSFTLGEARFEDKLTVTIAPGEITKSKALQEWVLREIARLPDQALSDDDRLSMALLRRQAEITLQEQAFPSALLPIDHYGGLPVTLAQLASGQSVQQFKTVKNYENFLRRLHLSVQWNTQAISNMRAGIQEGIVLPKVLIERALESLQPLAVQTVASHPYYQPVLQFPKDFSQAQRQRLKKAYSREISTVLQPSLKRLVQFMRTEYLPQGRSTAGLNALPGGEKWYSHLVQMHTTTTMTPDAIHALGLADVARIRGEMEKVKAHYQYTGALTDFLRQHEKRLEFRPFKTDQDVLDAYVAINNKVKLQLPQFFSRAPKAQLEIRAEPAVSKATASDNYAPPSPDGKRPGIFFAVIMDPKDYSTTWMTSLFLHEGQPGHHFHLAGQQELRLPDFRKYDWITAFGEGWALYAETLGHEMGLYEDPNALLGHLGLELLRAVRLVTDTGLHAQGWSREKTMQYMMDTEGKTEADARRATERYMAGPAQALAYKIGALKIRALRDKAQATMGTRFSYADFHEQVLSDGAMPLDLLEAKLDRWMGQTKH